jgi:hypothetical protein
MERIEMKRLFLIGVFLGLVCSLYALGKRDRPEPEPEPPNPPPVTEVPSTETSLPEEDAYTPSDPTQQSAPVQQSFPTQQPSPARQSFPTQQSLGRRMLAVLPFTGVTDGDGEALALLFSNNAKLRENYIVVPLTRNVQQRVKMEQQNVAIAGTQTAIDLVMIGIVRNIRNNNVLLVTIVEYSTRQLIAGDFRIYRDPSELQTLIPEMITYMIDSAQKDRAYLPRMAVTPFDTPQPGVSAGEAEMLALLLSAEIASSGTYAVLPRMEPLLQAMDTINQIYAAGAQDMSQSNADLVLTGSVITLGTKNLFIAQIERIVDGGVEHGAEESYETSSDGILQVIPRLSQALTGVRGRAIPSSNTPAMTQPYFSTPPSGATQQQPYTPSGGDYRPTVVVPQGPTTGTTGGTYTVPSGGTTYTAPSSGTYTQPSGAAPPQQYFNPLAPR